MEQELQANLLKVEELLAKLRFVLKDIEPHL